MSRNCLHCNSEYIPKRKDAKFCSNLCRARYSNSQQKQPQNTGAANNPENNNPVTVVQSPTNYPSAGPSFPQFIGLGNAETGYLQQRNRELESDNQRLRDLVKNYEIEERIRVEKAAVPSTGFLGFGSAKEFLTDPTMKDLIKEYLPIIMRGGNSSQPEQFEGSGPFTGIDEERRDQLTALVEILKPQPDQVIELFLGLAGKASENPEMFLQGVNEGANKLQETTEKPIWTP